MTLLPSSTFVRDFRVPDYLVPPILQRRFIYALTGQTGAGKTAITLLLSHMISCGKPLGGLAVTPGRVLFCAGENPDDIRMRWIAMGSALGFDPADHSVYFTDGTFRFSEVVSAIRRQVTALGGVDLVIVDTSAAFSKGTTRMTMCKPRTCTPPPLADAVARWTDGHRQLPPYEERNQREPLRAAAELSWRRSMVT